MDTGVGGVMDSEPTVMDTSRWVHDMTLGLNPARICEYPLVTPTGP